MPARPIRPYLIRALNSWIVDSDLTPYLMVDATSEEVVVPRGSVNDGRILLNISGNAVRDLDLGDELVSFSARFSGTPFAVSVPVSRVVAIYARETNEGMMFESESSSFSPPSADDDGPGNPGSHLTLVQ